MQSVGRLILVLTLIIGFGGCGDRSQQTSDIPDGRQPQVGTFEKVRGPVVAGAVKPEDEGDLFEPPLFYPRHPETLAKMVDAFLAEAQPEPVEKLRGLVCPHAGYEFSGPTAAFAYKLLVGQDIRTVILMGGSHTALFDGASIPDADAYETPLGLIPISGKAAKLAEVKPFVVNPPCQVQRPAFWRFSPGGAPRPADWPPERPAFGEDTPHTWEHSLEVQLPFLQRTLKDFSIVPILFGQQPEPEHLGVDPEEVARVLARHIDDKTLLVASSDLSHYHNYETAKGLDATCCQAICSLNTEWMETQEACGKGPILALMHLARAKGWKAKLLDHRNSGDTAGDKLHVVGYAAVAFYEPGSGVGARTPPEQPGQGKPTSEQQEFLLELARRTLGEVVRQKRLPQFDSAGVPPGLTDSRACFVTLNKDGRLRGCIGDIFPRRPLYQAVVYSAAAAAVADRRFRPVGPEELDEIEIEISLLSLPTRLEFKSPEELLERLRPGVDGVVLRLGQKQATYLPQVWEQIPDKQEFLERLAEKAGLERSGWRSPQARVLLYQAEAFHEESEK
jgi:hypothetical protein